MTIAHHTRQLTGMLWIAGMIGWVMPLMAQAADSTSAARAKEAEAAVGVLRRHCVECHGEREQEGSLRLDRRDGAIAGGDSGPAVVAGDADTGELLRRVRLARSESEAMPPVGDGLSAEEVAVLEQWIATGAAWPDTLERPHWAYLAPHRHTPPADAANTIDGWVASAHAEHGLAFADEASPETLIRRVSLDLTGLPPSPEAVAAFVRDPSTDAYEHLVDRLLASEEFGVRWARMWLDLARYADSHGFQRDDLRNLWAYRDWVVDALNADMPFDTFTIHQVAGDLLADATESSRIATGFHRCSPTNVEAGTDPEESRFNQVIDRVNTTAAVWLGSTLECAQCHDHKYDPFTQTDYYRLAAYFNSTESEVARANPKVPSSIKFLGPTMPLSNDPWAAERAELTEQIRVARKSLKAVQEAKQTLDDLADQPPADDPERKKIEKSIASIEKSLATLTKKLDAVPKATSLVMKELAEPRETFVLSRGELSSPGTKVEPGTPAVLPAGASSAGNRLALAEWLVARDNPLTARVIVNRIWHEVFGRGIVATLEDFGVKGEPPTHPELLDTLAVDLMDDGWSLKRLLRRIVLSRTYRQASRATAEARSLDPDNRWLARGPRFRLTAEAIRDNALAIAGLVSLEKGGLSIRPPQPDGLWTKVGGEKYAYKVSPGEAQYRRGLYVVLKRGSPYPSFVTFDATARMTCLVKRPRSNTPLQALVLLNDTVFTEAAVHFAARILNDLPDASDEQRLEHAYQVAVARQPKSAERDVLLGLLAEERADIAAEPESVNELLADHQDAVAKVASPEELAAWYGVATTLLNLDETITKP